MLWKSPKTLAFNVAILDEFPLFKIPATPKLVSVYALPGGALVPDFRFLKCWLLNTGTKFQIKYGFHKVNSVQVITTASENIFPDGNIT